jgi:hypothetical protein
MAQESAEAAIAVATEHGLPFELAYGTFARGWALAQQGNLDEGIAGMRGAVAAFDASAYGPARDGSSFSPKLAPGARALARHLKCSPTAEL